MLPLRDYTRVEIFLPLNEATLPKIHNIITELRDKFGGITSSRATYPTTFVGRYVEKKESKTTVYEDSIVWLMIDVDTEQIPDIENYFLKFKSVKEMELQENEIWVTCHSISRFIQVS